MPAFSPAFTLRIQHPLLSEEMTGNSVQTMAIEPSNKSEWLVTLTKVYDFLKIEVVAHDMKNCRQSGDYMHIIPMNGGKPIDVIASYRLWKYQTVSVQIHAEHVQRGGRYEFYIIQANETEIPWYACVPNSIKPPMLPAYQEEAPSTATEDLMSTFLCDMCSVDTQIVFGPTRTNGETCLWAHRVILSKHNFFDTILKKLSFGNRLNVCGPLTLQVNQVSFHVFATLLKFLYTGEIHRTTYPESFVISKSAAVSHAFTAGGTKGYHSWHCMDLEKPLHNEPVTWQELLDAANVYRLETLRARCEAALRGMAKVSMKQSTDAT